MARKKKRIPKSKHQVRIMRFGKTVQGSPVYAESMRGKKNDPKV